MASIAHLQTLNLATICNHIGVLMQIGTFFKRSLLGTWLVIQVLINGPFLFGTAVEQAIGTWCGPVLTEPYTRFWCAFSAGHWHMARQLGESSAGTYSQMLTSCYQARLFTTCCIYDCSCVISFNG